MTEHVPPAEDEHWHTYRDDDGAGYRPAAERPEEISMAKSWGGDEPKDFGVPPASAPRKPSADEAWQAGGGSSAPRFPYRGKKRKPTAGKRGLLGRKKK